MTGSADPRRRLTPVVRLAPAKLNLTLAVVGRRADGYHALHSVMAPIAIADRLSLTVDPSPGATDSLRVEGAETGPIDDNLVTRALAVTRRAVRTLSGTAPPALVVRPAETGHPLVVGASGGPTVAGPAHALAAWLTGRSTGAGLSVSPGGPLPAVPAWI